MEALFRGKDAPLGLAIASADRHDCVRVLLEGGSDPNRRLTRKPLPLVSATYDGDPALVDLLLSHGADPCAATVHASCLSIAAHEGLTAIVSSLIGAGALLA